MRFVIKPDADHKFETLPGFIDHPVLAVQTPPIPVQARQFYRIRVMARMLIAAPQAVGGLIIRDSIGGEALQFRTSDGFSLDWREIILYRRAPADGELTVTFGFAAFGLAEIDDVRIDRIEQLPAGASPSADLARRLPPRRPPVANPPSARR